MPSARMAPAHFSPSGRLSGLVFFSGVTNRARRCDRPIGSARRRLGRRLAALALPELEGLDRPMQILHHLEDRTVAVGIVSAESPMVELAKGVPQQPLRLRIVGGRAAAV